MTEQSLPAPLQNPPERLTWPLLIILFLGSGCAALIYEIVWFQLLEMVIGSSAVSLAVLLGTYMGGMGAGSLFLSRLVPARRHPLRVYAAIEAGIGIMGLAILFGMPAVVRFYSASAGHGLGGLLLRGAVSALCLLLPTLLMGATLPAVSRWIESTPRGVSRMGLLYGINTLGAVAGCLLAGFVLLRVYDMAVASFVAVGLNAAVAVIALILAGRTKHRAAAPEPRPDRELRPPGTRAILITIALSGLCALGAEVVWTRLLSLLLGGTVYTFSIILAVFLAGLGLGSCVGSFLARQTTRPRAALAVCQILLTAAIAWAAFMAAKSLPFWPINPTLSRSPWFGFQLDIVRTLWAVFPAACLWGASFPLALAAIVVPGRDPGRAVGSVYAANTAGAIVGALGFSLFLIPGIGTQQSQRLMIVLSAAAALAALFSAYQSSRAADRPRTERIFRDPATTAAILAGTAVLTVLAAWSVPKLPWDLVAWGRSILTRGIQASPLYVGEGMNSSVAVTLLDGGIRNFHVGGKVEASSDAQDMRLQRMLGHVPAMLHPNPRSVLIVGCGAGVTAGSFVVHPGVERIVICEIEPLIPKVVALYFAGENHGLLDDPRVEIVIDDARHYILTTRETFDIITSDPIHPWIKGSAALYSKEYFELCRRRLKPGGLITQWVPLYESNPDAVKSELATFFDVFPRGTIWANDLQGMGYDVVLLGQESPLKVDLESLEQKMNDPAYEAAADSIREVGFSSAVGLFSTYAGQGPDLRTWLKDAAINRDRNLRLQYLAGMGLNQTQGLNIFDDILSFRRYPEEIFSGSAEQVEILKKLLQLTK
jgi:spermidine synthase